MKESRHRGLQTMTREQSSGIILRVMEQVSLVTGISVEQMKGLKRNREIVDARMMVSFLCDEMRIPLVHIGEAMGRRDHSTIINHVKSFEDFMCVDRNLKKIFKRVRQQLVTENFHYDWIVSSGTL